MKWFGRALILGLVVATAVAFSKVDDALDQKNASDETAAAIGEAARDLAEANAARIADLEAEQDATQAALDEANFRLAALGQPTSTPRSPGSGSGSGSSSGNGGAPPSSPAPAPPDPVLCTLSPAACRLLGL